MKILITGITGFIGGYVCQRFLDEGVRDVTALVRPDTLPERYARFIPAVRVLETDLTDGEGLERLWTAERFDCVCHLAAVRGGGNASRAEFERTNVCAALTLAQAAFRYGAGFLFCSSAGVFGTIPQHLPPTEETPKIADNDYHATKIEAERRLLELQQQGLRVTIIRPIITYGPGDRGFPFQLVHLTAKGLLALPSRDIRIHLVDVQSVAEAFWRAAIRPETRGKIYTITDQAPVSLRALVRFIAMRLSGRPYPAWKIIPTPLLRMAEYGLEHIVKDDRWLTRIKLMSRDWWYDGSLAARELQVQPQHTIPNFAALIDWYNSADRSADIRVGV